MIHRKIDLLTRKTFVVSLIGVIHKFFFDRFLLDREQNFMNQKETWLHVPADYGLRNNDKI